MSGWRGINFGYDSDQNLGFWYTSNYRVLDTAPGRTKLSQTLRQLVAINFENTLSRPDAESLTSSYFYRYCGEITNPYASCAAMASYFEQLACQRGNITINKEHCKVSQGTPMPTNVQVDAYAKEMLYLMVQIQYLDRWVISKPESSYSIVMVNHLQIL